jgi:mRNA interferase RelE/StbE
VSAVTKTLEFADAKHVAISQSVGAVIYLPGAARQLRKHGNIAGRMRKAVADDAADPRAHANNVTPMKGDAGARTRVGDFRVIFKESNTEIVVTHLGPRGDVYD